MNVPCAEPLSINEHRPSGVSTMSAWRRLTEGWSSGTSHSRSRPKETDAARPEPRKIVSTSSAPLKTSRRGWRGTLPPPLSPPGSSPSWSSAYPPRRPATIGTAPSRTARAVIASAIVAALPAAIASAVAAAAAEASSEPRECRSCAPHPSPSPPPSPSAPPPAPPNAPLWSAWKGSGGGGTSTGVSSSKPSPSASWRSATMNPWFGSTHDRLSRQCATAA
mmetsp:Transcript_5201/g.13064  ORF Transcript_5201/g.13064 Transcript_5201/m.13064 type:complete len:221 (+) Transcript_5201:1320-1982(+)